MKRKKFKFHWNINFDKTVCCDFLKTRGSIHPLDVITKSFCKARQTCSMMLPYLINRMNGFVTLLVPHTWKNIALPKFKEASLVKRIVMNRGCIMSTVNTEQPYISKSSLHSLKFKYCVLLLVEFIFWMGKGRDFNWILILKLIFQQLKYMHHTL